VASILERVVQPVWVVDQTGLIRFANLAFTDISERRRTEHALRERDAVLSALGQPVWVVTYEGLISYVNPAAVTALGFGDAAELSGQNGHWLVHYKRPDGSRFPIEDCPLTRVRQTGEPLEVAQDWWIRKDGSMLPVSYTAVPIPTPDGWGTAVAFTDMTERLAAEKAARARDVAEARTAELAASEARQRAILEAALDGVISIDQRARITYANSALCGVGTRPRLWNCPRYTAGGTPQPPDLPVRRFESCPQEAAAPRGGQSPRSGAGQRESPGDAREQAWIGEDTATN